MPPNLKVKSCNRIVLTLEDSKGGSEMFFFVTGGGERSSLKIERVAKISFFVFFLLSYI